MAAGGPAENSVFMLEPHDIVRGVVEAFCPRNVLVDVVVRSFTANGFGIIIAAADVRHRHDARRKVGTGRRDRTVDIMGKGRDAAEARKMVADKCYSPN